MDTMMALCALFPMAASPVVYALGKKSKGARDLLLWSVTFLELVMAIALLFSESHFALHNVCQLGVTFSSGGFKGVLAALCALVFFLSALSSPSYFAGEERISRYYAFLLLTLGGVEGVFFSADLFTTFIFFEIMSMASWVWVAQNETDAAEKAANTYLAIAVIGGLLMLGGMIAVYAAAGTLSYAELQQTSPALNPNALLPGAILLTAGFGAKAGMFPLHIWLPKAHPVAPAPASALLSGILTKSGIFGIILCATCLVWGDARYAMLLLLLGVITMLLGAFLALAAVDLKRVLACSSLSQIGFILVAVSMIALGRETSLAAGGALLHAVNHALIKLVLFVSAGVLYKNYHTLNLNELRGAGRGNRLLTACFLIGSLSIAGVPLFGGYVSKTLIHEAIVEHSRLFGTTMSSIFKTTEILFLFAGGLTFAYMTKLFVTLFVAKRPVGASQKAPSMDRATGLALAIPSAALFGMGLLPNLSFERIAAYAAESLRGEAFRISYFSLGNLKGALFSLLIGAAVYIIVVRLFLTKNGKLVQPYSVFSLEEGLYKPLLKALAFLGALAARLVYCVTDLAVSLLGWLNKVGTMFRSAPPEDDHFGRYSQKYVKFGEISQTLAFELLLFGIGVVVTLLYLLFF